MLLAELKDASQGEVGVPTSTASEVGLDAALSAKERMAKEGKAVEKKDKKKDAAEGTFKITSFFTKKPASACAVEAPAKHNTSAHKSVSAPPATASGKDKAPTKDAEECILLDSDSESTAMHGSSTPPTASKKADAGKQKEEKNLSGAMQVEKNLGGSESAHDVASASTASTASTPASATSAAAVRADGSTASKAASKKAGKEGKTAGSVRPSKADSLSAKAKEDVSKGRQGVLCFQPSALRQNTLETAGKAVSSNVVIKKRPPHPEGTTVEYSAQFVSILQFCNSFCEPLEIEAVSTKDFDSALTNFPDDVLSQVHMGLLYTILMDSKDTKDEVNFLDADTWPEILRQHLTEARGDEGARARELATIAADYAGLGKEQRLDILEILVDDCLGTEAIKNFIDNSLDKIDEIRREEQLDILTDKYKKVDQPSAPSTTGGELMAFMTPAEEPLVDDLTVEGKTARQRALDRQREEEAREKKAAEEKRLREEKKLADEAARKKAAQDRKDRAEQRVLELLKINAQVRAPQVHTPTNTYVLVDCLYPGQRRVLFSEASTANLPTAAMTELSDSSSGSKAVTETENALKEAGKVTETDLILVDKNDVSVDENFAKLRPHYSGPPEWRLLPLRGSDVDLLLQHYSPAHCEDKGEMQRRLRDLLPTPTDDLAGEDQEGLKDSSDTQEETLPCPMSLVIEEGADVTDSKELESIGEENAHGSTENEIFVEHPASGEAVTLQVPALLLARVKELILDLDDCTPEDMFANFQTYIKMRTQWRETVESAGTVEELKGPLVLFEEAMRQNKMKEGWAASAERGNQRSAWVEDLNSVTSFSQMMYLVKVLTWFIGRRQKARSSMKIASIFTGEMRLTRARAGIVKPSRAAQEANDEIELSSDNEDSEQEKEWAEESDDEAPRRGTRRSTRASRRSGARNSRAGESGRSSQAPATRRSSRVTRSSSKRARESDSESPESNSDDENEKRMGRSSNRRVTRQRLTRGAYADLKSDSSD